MGDIIGRNNEIQLLEAYASSGKAEFVALYGRRRVGKTFLIREHFKNHFAFEMTGTIDGTREEQLFNFIQALRKYGYDSKVKPANWAEAFVALQQLLEKKKQTGRCIVFLDELPCLDTPRAGFVNALDHFWNSWASARKNVMLIVCGSATSWMVSNIIDNRGGLHNRITHEIHLKPFTLREVEQYLQNGKFGWSRLSMVQLYMIMGGTPYYLSLLDNKESLAQNVDRLFFAENGELKREYQRLYASLFRNPGGYMQIVRLLAECKSGLTREEIRKKLDVTTGGHLSRLLNDLVNCDFVRYYNVREKKIKSNAGIYQLTDSFTLFHFTFGKKNTTDEHYWSNTLDTPTQNTWLGLAFERVCMAHIPQIKKALGIDRIHTEYYSWRSKESEPKAQVDLVIERSDQIINLCEVKYAQAPYAISKAEDLKLRTRMENFRQETGTRAGIFLTFITIFGLKQNGYSDGVRAEVCMDDLFE